MGRYLRDALLGLVACSQLLLGAHAAAAAGQATCGPNNNCPASAPCCGAYGACGVGAYCEASCDIRYSYDLNSCIPAPVCQTTNYQMSSLDRVADISTYLGDSTNIDWVVSGKTALYNGGMLLTMAPDTVGTLVTSTHSVWYGKISATFTTSKGAGVVTAFILMSDTKDEIDYEFVGVDLQHAQTNFYSQGVTNYGNEVNISAANTDTTTHTYTIDWTEDSITWLVDGVAGRTKNKNETWNAKTGRYDFPQTPAHIQLSLWPAGLPSNGQGTIEWAGGLVDWSSPYMQNGYYYAWFKEIDVQCYKPPAGAQVAGSKTYIYTDRTATNQSIKIVDNVVLLKSLYANGDDPNINPDGKSTPTNAPNTVPGVDGIGTRGNLPGGSSNLAGSGQGNGSTSFSQGGSKNAAYSVQERLRTGGSAFAVLVALLCVCFWL